MERNVVDRINEHVGYVLPNLAPQERYWLQAHLAPPRVLELANDVDGLRTIRAWLVTDHTGSDDACYRIVYNPEEDNFGYECTLENGRELFLGHVGTLSDALEGL